METRQFKGVYSALVAVTNRDGSPHTAELRHLLDWQLAQGLHGFYLCGATAECHALTEQVRMQTTEVALSHIAGRASTIVHVGAHSVDAALRLARHAKTAGANALSALPPQVYQYTPQELVQYYATLAQAVDLPFIVYANNSLGARDITGLMGEILALPNVIGLKYTRSSYYEMNRISHLGQDGVNILNGPDQTLLCGLVMGADGGIGSTYNVMPDKFRALYDAVQAGDMTAAKGHQEWINQIITIILEHGLVRTLHHILGLQGFTTGQAQPPALPLTAEEKELINTKLQAAGYLRHYGIQNSWRQGPHHGGER